MQKSSENKTTIGDVARIAKVSKSTVSHVLNNTKNVSDKTREKILKVIEETGYTPNLVAKALKKSETKTIGLVISDIQNQYFIDVIKAISDECIRNGYMVFLADSNDDPVRELEIAKSFCERCVDGVILSPTANSEKYVGQYFRERDIPIVYIDRMLDLNGDWVGSENHRSMRNLTEHLISLGHKRIAFAAGLRHISTTEERIEGYKEALEKNGIVLDEALIIEGESRSGPAERGTKEIIERMMGIDDCPTAIIAANNLMVLGVMKALSELNIRVPEDMAVVAFDDCEWAGLFRPRLTAVAQPCKDIGRKAAELLLERIHDRSGSPQRIYFQPELVVRESCGSKRNIL
ncbi:MAG: LacI family transcriptional regulator [Dorea sp.]|jgi:LacI family transcriptional regulator|nr:LacI family transcriptional regulator [Dorea sp.]